jgi:hypothetical protein
MLDITDCFYIIELQYGRKIKMKQQIQQTRLINEVSGFMPASDDSYYLNSSYIKTVNNILTHGCDYLLVYYTPGGELEFKSMRFITAGERDGWVTIDLENNQFTEKQSLSIPMLPGQNRLSPFLLLDIDSLVLELNVRLAMKDNHASFKRNTQDGGICWEKAITIISEEVKRMLQDVELFEFEF